MSNISFETIYDDINKPLCVFGCLLTERGKQIKNEMIQWLSPTYTIICVNQEAPGNLFEYPALICAKRIAIKFNISILYLHTKGAAHSINSDNIYEQSKVIQLWKHEFIECFDWYHTKVSSDPLAVAAPFVSDWGMTWMNGFIAGPAAWKNSIINPPEPSLGRLVYEYIFKNTIFHPYSRIMAGVNGIDDHFEKMVHIINECKYNN